MENYEKNENIFYTLSLINVTNLNYCEAID